VIAETSVGSGKRSPVGGMAPGNGAEGLFTFPWPGPGNSEGPVDPDRWSGQAEGDAFGRDSGTTPAAYPRPGPR
jgi:hypothetical protein